jgi:hypothetical protein
MHTLIRYLHAHGARTNGYAWLVAWLICFQALHFSGCYRDPIAYKELTAIRFIHLITKAEAGYKSEHGHYAELTALRSSGALDPSSAAAFEAAGYRVRLEVSASGYGLTAWRTTTGEPRYRSFYCDQTGVVRESFGPALANEKSERTDGIPE